MENIVVNGKTVCTISSNPTDGLTMAAKLKINEKIGYLAGNVAQKLYIFHRLKNARKSHFYIFII